ncbi:hypothetical protein HKBW3S03_00261 [Candidatus Hakubella thermalkaliphila]|uniref:Antitoxin n=1 Tax=Candidatus Hakubella thermalkaliphila TaxID=2754717 RepID=A0A6V8PCG9_9ACTN|nr:type II toxin-antitoxin system Phd/YefM family antitoxin [Candidatus Hakubella thermalkaliphila]GFP18756.1 hypothetical protein HKBW3S03_00261 [Candidatus Hakubella thermalkaliphila]GFP22947.1 hypothetical protein HKBW3S09_00414 [Candidatus Hakubella thermalkaliphila]GFP30405.1 hypothetical protein HKBW3S34_01326 [Candidatus Hakubella thermalkaliphila]GFP38907.1 hypothetical protein HKBW3S47_00607 [Candidatus Hakubella thermalkaliphila]GFP41556.1 hypothetical protein HKBW3C_00681 [Candidatu
MRKRVSTIQVRDKLGEILDQTYYRGDEFVIERKGKALAVIVPFEEYERWQLRREESFAIYDRLWEANREFTPEQVEKDVAEAVKAGREKKPGHERSRP